MAQTSGPYIHGHHESVLRSHTWRTDANSAGYLLDSISPHMTILDVGCGPGTITADFAALVVPEGHVVGLGHAPEVLDLARKTAAEREVKNVKFEIGDIHALEYPDNTFDVVHAHQVLQHISDPIQALREMRRVAKSGGIIAARDTDFLGMTWHPDVAGMNEWRDLYIRVARSDGGEPNAGRQLHAWARKAGFDRARMTVTADRTVHSAFAKSAIDNGCATKQRVAETWRKWGAEEDGWFTLVHGEILCHK